MESFHGWSRFAKKSEVKRGTQSKEWMCFDVFLKFVSKSQLLTTSMFLQQKDELIILGESHKMVS